MQEQQPPFIYASELDRTLRKLVNAGNNVNTDDPSYICGLLRDCYNAVITSYICGPLRACYNAVIISAATWILGPPLTPEEQEMKRFALEIITALQASSSEKFKDAKIFLECFIHLSSLFESHQLKLLPVDHANLIDKLIDRINPASNYYNKDLTNKFYNFICCVWVIYNCKDKGISHDARDDEADTGQADEAEDVDIKQRIQEFLNEQEDHLKIVGQYIPGVYLTYFKVFFATFTPAVIAAVFAAIAWELLPWYIEKIGMEGLFIAGTFLAMYISRVYMTPIQMAKLEQIFKEEGVLQVLPSFAYSAFVAFVFMFQSMHSILEVLDYDLYDYPAYLGYLLAWVCNIVSGFLYKAMYDGFIDIFKTLTWCQCFFFISVFLSQGGAVYENAQKSLPKDWSWWLSTFCAIIQLIGASITNFTCIAKFNPNLIPWLRKNNILKGMVFNALTLMWFFSNVRVMIAFTTLNDNRFHLENVAPYFTHGSPIQFNAVVSGIISTLAHLVLPLLGLGKPFMQYHHARWIINPLSTVCIFLPLFVICAISSGLSLYEAVLIKGGSKNNLWMGVNVLFDVALWLLLGCQAYQAYQAMPSNSQSTDGAGAPSNDCSEPLVAASTEPTEEVILSTVATDEGNRTINIKFLNCPEDSASGPDSGFFSHILFAHEALDEGDKPRLRDLFIPSEDWLH